MEAHESFRRFERVAHGPLDDFSRTAAIVVAVLAAFLAIAMFLSNEAIKEAITGPPHLLDSLTDALGAEPDFKLRRLGLDQLEAAVEDAAAFLVTVRVEAKLARLDGAKLAHVTG